MRETFNKNLQDKNHIWIDKFDTLSNSLHIEDLKALPSLLALIHPEFYFSHTGRSIIANIPWKTNGSNFYNGISKVDNCKSEVLNGKKCEFNDFPEIRLKCHADHVWPNSLGGPSILDNRLILCRFHNTMKSNSINYFNWTVFPVWLKSYLNTIYSLKKN